MYTHKKDTYKSLEAIIITDIRDGYFKAEKKE